MKQHSIIVITRTGDAREFNGDDHHWSWGIVPGTIDRDDFGRVEVWQSPSDPDEEGERIAVFIEPSAVLIVENMSPTASQLRMFDQVLSDRTGLTDEERLRRAWVFVKGQR